jgi:hypothetical protein
MTNIGLVMVALVNRLSILSTCDVEARGADSETLESLGLSCHVRSKCEICFSDSSADLELMFGMYRALC